MTSAVYFVSGHLDITEAEWDARYRKSLDDAIADRDSRFVVGDARGCDARTIRHLYERGVSRERVTVYHMFDAARNNDASYPTLGGFATDEQRDEAMTRASVADIAWVRPKEAARALCGKRYRAHRVSGTQKNIQRRHQQTKNH